MSGKVASRICVAAALLLCSTSAAAQSLPPYFKLPPQASVKEGSFQFEPYGEAAILMGADRHEGKRGRHYFAAIKIDLVAHYGANGRIPTTSGVTRRT